jgi:hypothetical protein
VGTFAAALILQPLDLLEATDCNGNGVDDPAEVARGSALDCNRDGVPDECDVLPVNCDLEGPELFVGNSGGPLALADFDDGGAVPAEVYSLLLRPTRRDRGAPISLALDLLDTVPRASQKCS